MTAIRRARLAKIGWDDDLVIESAPAEFGTPAGDGVGVEVEACGVCYRDCIDRAGRFPFIQLPVTPGHEAVGRVVAVGPGVTEWTVGDRVGTLHRDHCGECAPCAEGNTSLCERGAKLLGLTVDGGYATHLLAPQGCFFRMPADIPAAEAAVLCCTFGSSYRGLKKAGRLRSGEHVLITGANGGVGSAAIQVARRLGARVTAVVRDAAHADFVCQLGAAEVIVDPGERFHKRLAGGPADVVMDCVGEPTFNASVRSLRPGGRLIVVGNVVEERASLNLGYLITRGLEVIGSGGATAEDMDELLALHAAQPFAVQIDRQMDLADADRAQRLVRAGGLHGRIVLVPARR